MNHTNTPSIRLIFLPLIFSLSSCLSDQDLLPDNYYILEEGDKPWVIAHGGSKDLFPENTMMAFKGSWEIGVDALEMDIKITADDSLVCHHDATIDRMSDGEGEIGAYTLEELRAFNFGEGFQNLEGEFPFQDTIVEITPLEDVLKEFPSIYMVIEIKDSGERGEKAGEVLYDLLEKYGMKSYVIVASFDEATLTHFREYSNRSVPVSASESEAKSFVISSKALAGVFYSPEAVAVQLPMEQAGFNLAKRRVIHSAHRHNMAVHYWTIDDPEDMELLIDLGADGLITDRPDLMNELLTELGYE